MYRICFFISFLALFRQTAGASNVMDFESTYLGGGIFQYRMVVRTNAFVPLFTAQNISLSFTNRSAYEITPPSWAAGVSDFGAHGAAWDFVGNVLDGSASNTVFQVRSSETHFRQGTVRIVMSYILNPLVTGLGEPSIDAAYLSFAALLPCSAAEVDGSPTNTTAGILFVPDITILQMNVSGGSVTGLTYVWNRVSATMSVEASSDLKTWTAVDRVYGQAGTNTWISPAPLGSTASFYRLSLLGPGQILPPTTEPLSALPQTTFATGSSRVAGVRCVTTAEGFRLLMPTVLGGLYEVVLTDHVGTRLKTTTFAAHTEAETVDFKAADFPQIVLIQVRRLD